MFSIERLFYLMSLHCACVQVVRIINDCVTYLMYLMYVCPCIVVYA